MDKETWVLWYRLTQIPGLGNISSNRLLDSFGNAENIFNASLDDLVAVPGISERIAENILSSDLNPDSKDICEEWELVLKHNVQIISRFDEGYPPLLKEIYDPPILLYVKGRIKKKDMISVGMVGTRKATQYGKSVAESLSADLANTGITIISGLARGIDTASHKGALRANGRTIAVLGNGLDNYYPQENKTLQANDIPENGAVVSEFPMKYGSLPENFPRRNRIISGMSLGLIVVEAPLKSGALITARNALEQNREVYAVPGRITDATAGGTNMLIKQGAQPVTNAEDVFEDLKQKIQKYMAQIGYNEDIPGIIHKEPEIDKTSWSDEEQLIYNILGDESVHIDMICRKSGLEAAKISRILCNLELKGIISRSSGMYFARVA